MNRLITAFAIGSWLTTASGMAAAQESLNSNPAHPTPVPEQFSRFDNDEKVVPVAYFASVADAPDASETVQAGVSILTDRSVTVSPTTPVSGPTRFEISDVDDRDNWTAQGSVEGATALPIPEMDGGGDGSACGGGCDGGCSGAACGGNCGGTCDACCQNPVWQHRTGVFGEYLYLRARDAEISYAVPIDGPISPPPSNNPIQVGGIGMVDPDFQSGYRAGFTLALDACSSMVLSYTQFSSSTQDDINAEPNQILRSYVAHPSSRSASSDFLQANAYYDIDYELVDVNYRGLLRHGDRFAVNYIAGLRYGHLEQNFNSEFVDNGVETVVTNVDFEGAGLRLGLEGKRYSCCKRFFVYSEGNVSLLAGHSRADYTQGQSFDPNVVSTDWEAGRIVTIFDLELGAGWQSRCGRVRASAGYVLSAWTNTVKANHFIHAVQHNNFRDLEDTFTFDGAVLRAEVRF